MRFFKSNALLGRLWESRRLSVGVKFGLIIAGCTALVMMASFSLVSRRLKMEDAIQSEAMARATALQICEAVQGVFESAFTIVDTTHDTLIALKDDGIAVPNVYDTIVKRMVTAGGNRFGAWLVWDGADQPIDTHGDSAAHIDAKGRLAIYWHQNGMDMVRDGVPPEILDSDLFRIPYGSDKTYLLEPHSIDAVNGDPTLVTSFSKPLEHDGKVVGVLAVDVKLDALTDALSALVLPDGASITVVSDGGVVAMSTRQGMSGHRLTSSTPSLSRLLFLARHGDGSEFEDAPEGTTKFLTSWRSIRFAGVTNPWYLLLKVPERSLLATNSNDRNFILLVAAGALAAILATVLLTMNRVIAIPLKNLSSIIGGLGRGLFNYQIPGRDRADEVGDIARAIDRLQESGLQIARLKEESGEAEYQRTLARRAELDGISTHFSQSIETVVSTLGGVASTVETQSCEVSSNAKAAVLRLEDVAKASVAAKDSMACVATATTSLLTTIEAIGDRTRDGRAAAEKVERHTAATDVSITRLKDTISEIAAVASLIRAVADQINLIALNATIEAARAGESGRGFAVVAHEIKALATQTAKATAEISHHVVAVHQASLEADGNIGEMKQAFSAMHMISVDIAGALDIQLGATGDIGQLVDVALSGADGVALHLRELVHSSEQVQLAADLMLGQSGSLGQEISDLSGEVTNFLQFLRAV